MPASSVKSYQPAVLLDRLLNLLRLKNDAALAHRLGVDAPVISKVRHGKLPVGPGLLISMQEESGLSIGDMREMIGLPRRVFIKSAIQ